MKQQEISRIIDQINRLYSGDCWIGSNLTEILAGLTDAQVNQSVPGFANTIHQIVRHVLSTEMLVLKRLQGIDYVLTPEEDWMPQPEIVKIEWQETVRQLFESKETLVATLQGLDDSVLDRPIIKDYSTIYVTLHGHIQHTAYHFGQVMVLRRLVG